MKKIFVLILVMFFSVSLFAETGYRGMQWYDTEEKCSKIGHLKPYFKNGSVESILLEDMLNKNHTLKKDDTVILGKQNNVTYIFSWAGNNDYWLEGITYIVTPEQIKEIINRLTMARKYKTSKQMPELTWFEDETLTSLGLSEDLEDIPQEVNNLGLQLECFYESNNYEEFGENAFFSAMNLKLANEQNENLSGTLYIFDYNKDTRMYVFDNIVKGKSIVVYVPHEQDY